MTKRPGTRSLGLCEVCGKKTYAEGFVYTVALNVSARAGKPMRAYPCPAKFRRGWHITSWRNWPEEKQRKIKP